MYDINILVEVVVGAVNLYIHGSALVFKRIVKLFTLFMPVDFVLLITVYMPVYTNNF